MLMLRKPELPSVCRRRVPRLRLLRLRPQHRTPRSWTQCEQDGISAFQLLKRLAPSGPVTLLGFSLGTGVVPAIVDRVDANRLVLCAGFSSFRAAARAAGIPAFLFPARSANLGYGGIPAQLQPSCPGCSFHGRRPLPRPDGPRHRLLERRKR